jgi:hypothetical protein
MIQIVHTQAGEEIMNMNVDKEIPPQRTSFVKSLFPDGLSIFDIVWDIVFGILAPIVYVILDPIMYRSLRILCSPIESPLQSMVFFEYTAIGLSVIMLTVWLIAGRWIRQSSAFVAGIFFASAAFATMVGIILLPISLYALLLLCLGVLGFIPFLTAFVYLRNGVRAWRYAFQQDQYKLSSWLIMTVLTGALVAYEIPALVQWQAPRLFPQTQIVESYSSCPTD